jgi:repressor LexA
MVFSEWLSEKIMARHLRPSQLALYSKISGAEISRLLSGQRKPSMRTITKIAPVLHVNEEEIMRVAGYLPQDKPQPKVIEIPVHGECPASRFNFAFEEILDTVVLNYDFVKDRNCFALRVKGDCLKDVGIFNKDIVIVSPHAHIENGDIVIARVGDECTMKKFYKTGEQIVLQPCNHHYEPIIIKPKEKNIEIIGKVIRALKVF